ncbi:hypothetical protein KR52_05655 [Synechococcus sp. KORDI-52]|nr:hypothetical protein KR52_05655 [Synechococcus sp. KORDI-52]
MTTKINHTSKCILGLTENIEVRMILMPFADDELFTNQLQKTPSKRQLKRNIQAFIQY